MVGAKDMNERIAQVARDVIEPMGLDLWGVEIALDGHGQAVRVYLDSPVGVTIDQLAEASRHIGLVLEVEDFVPGSYRLELSSPGFERPFFSTEQMRGYTGQKVEVKMSVPLNNRKNFKGLLMEVRQDSISVEADGTVYDLRWKDVKKARLIVEDPWKHAGKTPSTKKRTKDETKS